MVGAAFALAIVGMALFAGTLAPHPPYEQKFDLIEARPCAQALFGTYRFGRYRKSDEPMARLELPAGIDGEDLTRIAEGVFLARDLRHERLVTAADAVLADPDRSGDRRMAS